MQRLDLWGNNIEVEVAKAIDVGLKNNTTLQRLGLELSNIEVEGAKAIGAVFKDNTTLQSLDLCVVMDNFLIRTKGQQATRDVLLADYNTLEQ